MVPQGALTWHVDRRILNEKLFGQVHPVVSWARLAWRTNQRRSYVQTPSRGYVDPERASAASDLEAPSQWRSLGSKARKSSTIK